MSIGKKGMPPQTEKIRPMLWRDYQTQIALRKAIRERVNRQPFDTPFVDSLISDLICERHFFCSLHGLRPSSFKKTREDYPYRFYGHFDHGWHPVSWDKCVSGPPSKNDIISRALRDRILPAKAAFRIGHPICAHCQSAPSEEVHHAEPTFDEIIDRITAGLTETDFDNALATWDWFKTEKFSLPDHLALVAYFDDIHRNARLEALCKPCHNKTKGSRKKSPSASEDVEKLIRDLL